MLSIQKWMRARLGRSRFRVITLALVAVMGALSITTAVPAKATTPDPYGTLELSGSSWLGGHGVDVYSNGPYTYVSNAYNYITVNGASVNVGMKWQCVELAQRLYTVMGWHSGIFPGVSGAADIYTSSAAAMGMTDYANGSITSIVPGDMIVHGTSDSYSPGYGHVAIVDYVSGSTVYAVQQNAPATTTYTLTSGTLTGGSGTDILGIVHSPNNTSTGTGGGASGTSGADLAWFTGNTLFTFAGSGLGTVGSSSYHAPTWGGVGDYNKDGKDDLFLYDGSTGTIYWMATGPDGVLGSGGIGTVRGPGVGAPDWAAVGDFDGDGYRNDLAWFVGNTLYTFEGSCLCTTGTVTGFHAPTWGGVGDYNHDGKDDLFLYDGSTGTIYWMTTGADGKALGSGGIGTVRGPGVGAPDWAAVGDFTGDGYRDSIAWFTGSTLYTFAGPGLGTIGSVTGYHAPTWGGVGDYNHDGKDDLLLYDGSTGTIYWMSPDANGVLGTNGIGTVRGPGVGAPDWAAVGNFG